MTTSKHTLREAKKCRNCPKMFTPTRDWQIFCSAKCRLQYWRADKAEIRHIKDTLSEHDKRIKKLEGRA